MKSGPMLLLLLVAACGQEPFYVEIATGRGQACAMSQHGRLDCYGKHVYDEVHHPPDGKYATLVAAGQHSCALDLDGVIGCWGAPYGDGSVPGGAYGSLFAGQHSACVLDDDGQGTCWGLDEDGALDIPEGPFVTLALGNQHGCGLEESGNLTCWGRDDHGQASPPEATFTAVSAAFLHSCGLTTGGELLCWGKASWNDPVPDINASRFVSLIGGGTFDCGVSADDYVECWGTIFPADWADETPREPTGPFTSLDADYDRLCVVDTEGVRDCFGRALWRQ